MYHMSNDLYCSEFSKKSEHRQVVLQRCLHHWPKLYYYNQDNGEYLVDQYLVTDYTDGKLYFHPI